MITDFLSKLRKPLAVNEAAIIFLSGDDEWLGSCLPGEIIMEHLDPDGQYSEPAQILKESVIALFETRVEKLNLLDEQKEPVRQLMEAAFAAGIFFERKHPKRFTPDDGPIEKVDDEDS